MSPERLGKWPKRHKKELGAVAGGSLVLWGLLHARRKVHGDSKEARREQHPNAEHIASVLVDTSREDLLPDINRMAALMVTLEKATKPQITELFGVSSAQAARYMAPLIRQRFVMFQQVPKRSIGQPQYIVNPEIAESVVHIAQGEPERYALFLGELAAWQEKLGPEKVSDNS